MNSMTGYGKAVVSRDGRTVTVEAKSVNNRFLDVSVKIPRCLAFLEDSVRAAFAKAFARGRIEVYVGYENASEGSLRLTLNEAAASEYLRLRDVLTTEYGLADDLTVSAALKIPGLVSAGGEEDADAVSAVLEEALSAALSDMSAMRAFEGERLKRDILEKTAAVEGLVDRIRTLAPASAEAYREKLRDRIEEILSGVEIDEAKLLNEAAFHADKACVDEEITRLDAHCVHLRKLLDADGPSGKKMDFLIQEFNREANTIGSKCQDAEVTPIVLSLKNEIEKIREQVQNVE